MFVILSSSPGHAAMARKVSKSTGMPFLFINDEALVNVEFLSKIGCEKIFVTHWSRLIKRDIFDSFETVVFHMTNLPFGRGGSPLQNLIVRGHTDTMISAFICQEGLDAGPILLKKPLSLGGTASDILSRAAKVIETMVEEIVIQDPPAIPQIGEVTTFRRRSPEESSIERVFELEMLYNHIRMLDGEGYPKAFAFIGPFKIEFSSAKIGADEISADVKIRLSS